MKRNLLILLIVLSFTIPIFSQSETARRETVKTQNGALTFVYSADGQRITNIEDNDSVVDILYDAAGTETGQTIHPRGTRVCLTVHNSGDRVVRTDGMPAIRRISDHDGRDVEVRTSDGTAVATYLYSPSGHTAAITLGDGSSLRISAPSEQKVSETLFWKNGAKIRQSVVATTPACRDNPAVLDVLSKELGLSDDWPTQVTFRRSASGRLTSVTRKGETILYLVTSGFATVGFMASGTPLFYEVMVENAARPLLGDGADAHPDVATELGGVVPDRVVLTRSRMIGVYVSCALDGAMSSIWTEADSTGNTTLRHRVVTHKTSHAANTSVGKSLTTLKTKSVFAPYFACLMPKSNTICTYGDYVEPSCTTTTVLEQYDCADSGGLGSATGGGGGAISGGGNKITTNTFLSAAVSRALAIVPSKLAQPSCSGLLDTLRVGGATLRQMMNSRGYYDPNLYMQNRITYMDGFSSGRCDGTNCAYTTPYSTTVYVCDKARQYSDSLIADFLIHEMLHTLGFPEYPATGAMTSSQINNMVFTACGK